MGSEMCIRDRFENSGEERITSSKEKLLACATHYVNSYPDSSWEDLSRELYWKGEMATVEKVKTFLPPRGRLTMQNYLYTIAIY